MPLQISRSYFTYYIKYQKHQTYFIFFGNCENLAELDSSIIDHRIKLYGMTSEFGVKEMAVEMEKVIAAIAANDEEFALRGKKKNTKQV